MMIIMTSTSRKTVPLKVSKIDWVKAIPDLQEQSLHIQNCIQNGITISCTFYSQRLFMILVRKITKTKSKLPIRPPNNKNCNSRNYQAIANMNLYTYETQIQIGIPFEQCMHFLEKWTNFEQLAIEADTRELNLQINKSWKNATRDGKKLWDLIDWHGKAEIKKETLIHDRDVDLYFRSIFQSENTLNHPTVSDIENIDTYEMYIPILDDTPQKEEFERATKKIGKGCGLDGIPAPVIRLLPPNLKYNIFTLIKNTFIGTYPEM